jgi:KaiC/GvpD/RAD55 family RecA-like ATPase
MGDYTLGIKELDNAINGIRKGSNILLIGPPMSQNEIILYNIIYHGAAVNENAVVIVTTQESGTNPGLAQKKQIRFSAVRDRDH